MIQVHVYSNWSNTLWKHYDVQYAMNDADKHRMMPFLSNTFLKKNWSIHGLNQKHSTTKKTGVHQVYRTNSAPISHNHFMVYRHIFQQNVLYQNYILSLSQYHKLNHSITFSFFQKYVCWNMTLKMDLKLWIWSRHKQLVLYPIVHMVLVFFLQSRFLCSSLAPIHYIGLTSMKVLIACLLCAFITHSGQ